MKKLLQKRKKNDSIPKKKYFYDPVEDYNDWTGPD